MQYFLIFVRMISGSFLWSSVSNYIASITFNAYAGIISPFEVIERSGRQTPLLPVCRKQKKKKNGLNMANKADRLLASALRCSKIFVSVARKSIKVACRY